MRKPAAVLLLLLLLPAVPAHHEDLPPLHDDGPLVRTDIVPVDRAQEDALALVDETIASAGDRVDEALAPIEGLVEVLNDTVNATLAAVGAAAQNATPPLYSDGTGNDPATGVLGPWRQVGHDAWRLDSAGKRTGEWGFSSDAPHGRYLAGAEALLLTPELDLRTGMPSTPAAALPVDPPVLKEARFSFWIEANLANGLDGVDLWLLNPEGRSLLKAGELPTCGIGCVRLGSGDFAVNGYTDDPVAALDGPGFTDYVPWTQVTVDLARWADPAQLGPRLWAGFHFASVAQPSPGYFEDTSLFEPGLSWYGLHLDDLLLTTAMPVANLQVHDLDQPARNHDDLEKPLLGLDDDIHVAAAIRNSGRTPMGGSVTLQVQGLPPAMAPDYTRTVALPELEPGRVFLASATFPPIGDNVSATAVVTVVPVLVAGVARDVEPNDDQDDQPFDVRLVRSVRIDGPHRQAPWVDRGQPFSATAVVHNLGTRNETVVLAARLIDARTGKDASDQLDEETRLRTVELPALQSMHLTWPIPTVVPGQYRFFVRTLDMPDYPICGGPQETSTQLRIPVPYRTNTIVLDQIFSTEEEWNEIPANDLTFTDETGEQRSMRMRPFHDGDSLYLALEIPDTTEDLPGSTDEDTLFVAFDDLGDQALVAGEDGLRIADGITQPNQDLEYDPEAMDWTDGGDPGPDAGRAYDPQQGAYRMELRRALNGEDPDALAAAAGSQVGLYMELVDRQDSAVRLHHFPPGGVRTDGQGIGQRDDDLDDETASWALLELAPVSLVPAFGDCGITDGFGVGIGPPLAFLFDPEAECEDGLPLGWAAEGTESVSRAGVSGVDDDGWNCAYYRAEGRTLLYEGMHPTATCDGAPCPQVSAVGGDGRSSATIDKVLVTPGIQVPASDAPSLILEHQYSTLVRFRDDVLDDRGAVVPDGVEDLFIPSAAWVVAQVADATGAFPDPGEDEILLVPQEGHYSTIENTLPFDPEGLRRDIEGGPNIEGESHSFCFEESTVPVAKGGPSCGWWAPAGHMTGFRPPDDRYPVGGSFSGSPWKIDRLPLYGTAPNLFDGHGNTEGGHSVDLRGQVVRFLFYFSPAQGRPDPLDVAQVPPYDFGWRIGKMAVDEGGVAVVDAGLQDLAIADLGFDPAVLGLGPGSTVRFTANVTNLGLRTVGADAIVSWRVTDANTTDPDHDGCRLRCEWEAGSDPLSADSDEDGLEDGQEVLRGSDPLDGDTDGTGATDATDPEPGCVAVDADDDTDDDCLADEWEVDEFGTLDAAGAADPDADGCNNVCEQRLGTSPHQADTDGDGLTDLAESDQGTDALAAPVDGLSPCRWATEDEEEPPVDADGDCLPDEWELEHFLAVEDPDASQTTLELARVNARGLELLCYRDEALGVPVPSAEQLPVAFACELARYAAGAVAVTVARVQLPAGDDLPFNDGASLAGIPIQVRRNGAIVASVTPASASAGFARTLRVEVRNLGNVPLEGGAFGVQQILLKAGLPAAPDKAWQSTVPIPVGATRVLHELETEPEYRATDRAFRPSAGDWSLVVRLTGVDDDLDPLDNVALAGFQARDTFYANDFAGLPEASPLVPSPLAFASPWGIFTDSLDGTGATDRVLRAGDARTGEMPAGTNASAVLPMLDLRGARSAGITIQHGYDLEEGYDGARLEVSADGETWEALPPVGQSASGHGSLVGANALGPGAVFTGASLDPDLAPTDPKRTRILSEFDLAQASILQRDVEFARFSTAGLAPHPSCEVEMPDGTRYCTAAGWDGWLVENVTLNEPRPRSGNGMWWSGSAGEHSRQHVGYVGTGLRVELDLTDPRDGEVAVARWSELRAGWQDLDLVGRRDGTGGTFEVFVEDDAGRHLQTPKTIASEPDGWTQKELSLSSDFFGKVVVLEFHYTSGLRSQENNEGWFLDDLSATRFLVAGTTPISVQDALAPQTMDEPGFVSVDCGPAGPFNVTQDAGLGPDKSEPTSACWSVTARQAERRGGWHLEDVADGPAGTPARVWRMAGPEDQGYPHQANTRLITPMVDLRQVAGDEAMLRFSHRHGFEVEDPEAPVLSARDGGILEVQEYDAATDSFGPWRQLTDNTQVDGRLVFTGNAQGSRLTGIASLAEFEATGYNAVFGRGTFVEGDVLERRLGVGSPFQPMPGICVRCVDGPSGIVSSFPVTPAFSGTSDGWVDEGWDISGLVGKRVRFAFHAWTNPSDPPGLNEPLEGWTVGDISVSGRVFTGAPVQVRLRAGTDATNLDGHWSIDDIDIAGSLYDRKLALLGPSEADVAVPAAAAPEMSFTVANLGGTGRARLALGATATTASGEPVPLQLVGTLPAIPASQLAQAQVASAWGPFAMVKEGETTYTLRLEDPPEEPVRIEVRILEDHDVAGTSPLYGDPLDDDGGRTVGAWSFLRRDEASARFVDGGNGKPAVLDVQPAADQVELSTRVANDGTVPATFTVEWRLATGGDQTWSNVQEVDLVPGETASLATEAPVGQPGVYEAKAIVSAGGLDLDVVSVEFPFQSSYVLWDETFDGLEEGSLPQGWSRGGSVDGEAGFRSYDLGDGGVLVWGSEPGSGQGYCDLMAACTTSGNGILDTAPLDLTQAINGEAILDLAHAVSFTARQDGAVLEATVLWQDPAPEWTPRNDCGETTDWVRLTPTSGLPHTGASSATPPLRGGNPLGAQTEMFQGIHGDIHAPVTSTYLLSAQPRWCPEKDGGLPLAGNVIALRYHVGVEAKAKPDREGWRIDSTRIASGAVAIGPPAQDGDLDIAIPRNVPKSYAIPVANLAPTWQTYDLHLDAPDGWTADVQPRMLPLGPGQVGDVMVSVTVPETAATSPHLALLTAIAREEPGIAPITGELRILLDVDPLPKADLALMAVVVEDPEGIEAGGVIPVFARIANGGQITSKPASVVFLATNLQTGETVPFEVRTQDGLCAAGRDGCLPSDAEASLAAEWLVPPPGEYRLTARIDPERRLIDRDVANNEGSLDVTVKPLQSPDLRVGAIQVKDVGPEGLVEKGSLLAISVTVENIGEVPIASSQLQILAGTVTITDATLPFLPKGANVTVTASKIATAGPEGTLLLTAQAHSTSEAESRTDNNEAQRLLTIRVHRLELGAPAKPIPAEGGRPVTVALNLTNKGNAVEPVELNVTSAPPGWKARMLPNATKVPPGGAVRAALAVVPDLNVTGGDWPVNVTVNAGRLWANATVLFRIKPESLAPEVTLLQNASETGATNLTLLVRPRSNVREEVFVTSLPGSAVDVTPLRLLLLPGKAVEVPLAGRIFGASPPGIAEAGLSLTDSNATWTVEHRVPFGILPTLRGSARWLDIEAAPLGPTGMRAVKLKAEVVNEGNLPFILHVEGVVARGSLEGPRHALLLDPGQSTIVDLDLLTEEAVGNAAGTMTLQLGAPSMKRSYTFPLPSLLDRPDLALQAFEVVARGQSAADVSARVLNDGPLASAPCLLHVYVDGVLATLLEVPALGPGASQAVSGSIPLPAGDHVVSAVVDGDSDVVELHEDNNGRSVLVDGDPASGWARIAKVPAGPWVVLAAVLLLLAAIRRRR